MKHEPRSVDGWAVYHAAQVCIVPTMGAPVINAPDTIEVAVAMGADRQVAAELVGGVIAGFNSAMLKRE